MENVEERTKKWRTLKIENFLLDRHDSRVIFYLILKYFVDLLYHVSL